MKKTVALTAVLALAVPAAAQAKKPAEPGKQGHDKAAEKHAAKKPKGKAFTLKGTGLTALPVTDGALTGPITLDPKSANKHARTFLSFSREDVKGTKTGTFGDAGDKVVVRYKGLAAGDALQATDVVKVFGKVTGTTLDIRRITISRKAAKDEQEEQGGSDGSGEQGVHES